MDGPFTASSSRLAIGSTSVGGAEPWPVWLEAVESQPRWGGSVGICHGQGCWQREIGAGGGVLLREAVLDTLRKWRSGGEAGASSVRL